MTNKLLQTVNKVVTTVGSYGNTGKAPEHLDRYDLARLDVELVKNELRAFIAFCYRVDDGYWVNIYPTGLLRYGVSTPFGAGGKHSQLTRTQRDRLRRYILSQNSARHFTPFIYYKDKRRWGIDLRRYDTIGSALSWVDNCKLDAGVWLRFGDQ